MKIKPLDLIIWLVLPFVFPANSFACQCSKASYKFTSRLHKAPFVGYVEIVGYDTIQDHDFDRTFTIVKVLEQFQGKLVGIIIPILDGSENSECQRSLNYFQMGKRFIIKASFENRKNHEFDWEDTPLSNVKTFGDQVLTLSICSENVIEVDEGKAIGNITKPRLVSKYTKDRFFSAITFGLIRPIRLRTGNYTGSPQEIGLEQVIKLIKNRTKLS